MADGLSEERVKELAMAEVAKQVKPLHDWMLSFWSNGSGRPPGYFQMRVKADDERYTRLEKETIKQSEVLERLDANMQQIAAEKLAESQRKQRRQERIKFWLPIVKWVLGGVTSLILLIGGWAVSRIEPVIKILWEDYLRAHPAVTKEMKSLSFSVPDGVYADDKPQDAGIPPLK